MSTDGMVDGAVEETHGAGWDETYDVVVVGTGGAGFATAMGAVDEGLSVLMLESSDSWGGNTAMSGGGMWLPDNALMRRDGVGDSREEALTYLEACVGDVGRATSRERKEAFVDGVGDFVATAERFGVVFARATDYPDYYPELPGGKIGRALEVKPLDSKVLGPWWDSLRGALPVPAMTNDVWLLGRAWSTPAGMLRGAKVVGRAAGGVLTGKRLVGIGTAWATAFCKAVVIDRGVPMWLGSPMTELIVDGADGADGGDGGDGPDGGRVVGGRVVGVRVQRGEASLRVRARLGVVLASGGFESNAEWRRRFHGIDGATSGSPSNMGSAIAAAQEVGAAVELMDDAWWGASLAAPPGGRPMFLVGERSMPYSLMVNSRGQRFANESESYVDLGHRMLADDGGTGPYWLLTDARFARRYFRTFAMDPRAMKAMKAGGIVFRGRTIEELAARMAVDPATLRASIERFNGLARAGVDGDFERGGSAYDRYYGDPTVHPSPNLAPLEHGPFTAHRVVLGDLGTKGGVVTDADARALREDGSVIEGLFAAGNASASVMGTTYPGPGSTIAPAVVFGLRAARFMAHRRA